MGIYLSTPSPTSPFFLTTGIIGLVSFAFTLATFLKVVWTNLTTLSEAEHEVHTYLTNLRTELLEERAALRTMRKICKKMLRNGRGRRPGSADLWGPELDDQQLKTMADLIRHLIRKFKEVEKPFLEPGEQGIQEELKHGRAHHRDRSRGSVSPYYTHEAYGGERGYSASRRRSRSRPGEKDRGRGRDWEGEDDDDAYRPQRTSYGRYGFWKRFIWIYKKPEAQMLVTSLERVQIRRIAMQVGGLAIGWQDHAGALFEVDEMVRRIEERMSRFVGVRRVGGEGSSS